MTRVLLVRHGQSEWNEAGRWQGQADPPLTDLGRLQARHAARALGAVDAVAASDLQRAAETATIIADELGVGPVLIDADLRERHAGEWQGLTRAQIARDWPGYLDPPDGTGGDASVGRPAPAGAGDPGDPQGQDAIAWTPRRPPGWEPDASVLARATAALARLQGEIAGGQGRDGEAVVITHGGVIYAIEAALGAPWERIANLGARWVELGEDGPVALGERVVLVDHDELTIPDQL